MKLKSPSGAVSRYDVSSRLKRLRGSIQRRISRLENELAELRLIYQKLGG